MGWLEPRHYLSSLSVGEGSLYGALYDDTMKHNERIIVQ